ncbi:MAG: hypothetical protein M1817_004232 [Caeruleum heppii]|nr:MAG: hypothetical protein M1817_004232 [Caeruleum heppii]
MQPQSSPASNERFFRYFQLQVTALQAQMAKLEDTPSIGGERADAVDHCLAGIARLSGEVKDASTYLPAYDQRTYAETIKALSEKLQETRAAFAPKQKFSFKTARKNNSAISLQDAAEIASAQSLKIPGYKSNFSSSAESSIAPTPNTRTPPNEANHEGPHDIEQPSAKHGEIRKPSFSQSSSVNMTNHKDVHVILPSSASHATSSGSLTSLRRCVMDLSGPTTSKKPFAGITLQNVRDSLVICGHVDGPAHVTDIQDSIIVVASRQFRMHDCKNVDVYLLSTSRPIIEGCFGIRFAPLPDVYLIESEKSTHNQWDQVDDFKWLKAEHSPNWRVLSPQERIPIGVWTGVVPGGPGIALEDILDQTVRARV